MASVTFGSVARQVQRLYGEGTVSGMNESQLLDRFLTAKDEVAFEALVARHGPMVQAVCRRVLRDDHAAEDAFQATFLLLVRKAGSIRGTDLLGPWLHRVAYRVAIRAGQAEAKRQSRETPSPDAVAFAPEPDRPGRELRLALHEVVDSLPEKYRAPVILCYLEGRTHDEAARSLQWPVGSVKGRLSRARGILKTRLERRGLTVVSAAIATTLIRECRASVPVPWREKTIASAMGTVAGKTAAAGVISAGASVLVEETARAMMIKKFGILAAGIAAFAMLAGGAAVLAQREPGTNPRDLPPSQPEALVPDAPRGHPLAAAAPAGEPSPQPAGFRVVADPPDNRTGAERAKEFAAAIEAQERRRDDLLAQIDIDEAMLEILRDRLKSAYRQVTQMPNPTPSPPAASDEAQRRVDALTEQVARARKHWESAADEAKLEFNERSRSLRALKRNVEILDRSIAELARNQILASSRPGKPNTVQLGDRLVVEVLEALPGRPITGERIVRPDGTISLGFYGDLKVEGLTRRQIKEKLVEHMRKFLEDESLGLVVGAEGGKKSMVAPADSDRVFVDDTQDPARRDGATVEELERKLDRALREIRDLKNRASNSGPRP